MTMMDEELKVVKRRLDKLESLITRLAQWTNFPVMEPITQLAYHGLGGERPSGIATVTAVPATAHSTLVLQQQSQSQNPSAPTAAPTSAVPMSITIPHPGTHPPTPSSLFQSILMEGGQPHPGGPIQYLHQQQHLQLPPHHQVLGIISDAGGGGTVAAVGSGNAVSATTGTSATSVGWNGTSRYSASTATADVKTKGKRQSPKKAPFVNAKSSHYQPPSHHHHHHSSTSTSTGTSKGSAPRATLLHPSFTTRGNVVYCTMGGCGKAFASAKNLKRHLVYHRSDRPFKCTHPGCEKVFKTNDHLVSHRLVHTRNKIYTCDHCGDSFSRKFSLQRHRDFKHGNKKKSNPKGIS